jgi:hypothetical protein
MQSCMKGDVLPQKPHLCGFSGTCSRMCELMWWRSPVVVLRSDVVALHSHGTAVAPLTCGIQIVGALVTETGV